MMCFCKGFILHPRLPPGGSSREAGEGECANIKQDITQSARGLPQSRRLDSSLPEGAFSSSNARLKSQPSFQPEQP